MFKKIFELYPFLFTLLFDEKYIFETLANYKLIKLTKEIKY